MKDIRIYYYKSGSLRKLPTKKDHRFTSVEAAEKHIEKGKTLPGWRSRLWNAWQWVIVEYTDNYESKIIKIIDND